MKTTIILAGLLLATPAVHAQTVSGYTFTATLTTKINGESTGAPARFKGSVAGKNGRLDIVDTGDGSAPDGYLLTNDGGKTFWTVTDKAKNAVAMSAKTVRSLIKGSGATVKNISQSAPKPSGAGITVGETTTKRYRTTLGYTLLIGKPDEIAMKTVETRDVDIAPATAGLPAFNPVVAFLAVANTADAFGKSGAVKSLPVGFPLRMAIDSTLTANKIAKRTETTLSCAAPVKASFAASLFVVPKGYRRE